MRLRLAIVPLLVLLLAACPRTPDCTANADCADGDPCSPVFPVAGGLKVAVLDVGQGDSIAVIAPSGCAAHIDLEVLLRVRVVRWAPEDYRAHPGSVGSSPMVDSSVPPTTRATL